MYFSLITPSEGREHEAAYDGILGPYAEHQWLWKLFAAPVGTPRDFVFRRRQVADMPRFYIVSHREPKSTSSAWHVQSSRYAPQLMAGDRLHFELRANPSIRHGRDGKSKRHDVVMEAKTRLLAERGLTRWTDWQDADKPALYDLVQKSCGAWLERRGAALGFVPDMGTLVVEGYEQRERADRSLGFSTVDFTGELTVTDPQTFRRALFEGIGSAKAFGCGLLLVRTAS
jgi:CRISPR system Cascade subunit CasE